MNRVPIQEQIAFPVEEPVNAIRQVLGDLLHPGGMRIRRAPDEVYATVEGRNPRASQWDEGFLSLLEAFDNQVRTHSEPKSSNKRGGNPENGFNDAALWLQQQKDTQPADVKNSSKY